MFFRKKVFQEEFGYVFGFLGKFVVEDKWKLILGERVEIDRVVKGFEYIFIEKR